MFYSLRRLIAIASKVTRATTRARGSAKIAFFAALTTLPPRFGGATWRGCHEDDRPLVLIGSILAFLFSPNMVP